MAEVPADFFETGGALLCDAVCAPSPGKKLPAFRAWAGGLFLFTGYVSGALIKAVFGLAGTTIGGMLALLSAAFHWNSALFKSGIRTLVVGPCGSVFYLLLVLVSSLQHILGIQSFARALTLPEQQVLRGVFNQSIALYPVRIIGKGQGIGKLVPASFAIGNLVYLKNTNAMGTLVHEVVHVWQYQHKGCRYIADALLSQSLHGRRGGKGDAYDWEAAALSGATKWEHLNAESAAQLVEDTWGIAVERHAQRGLILDARRVLSERSRRHMVNILPNPTGA